MSNHTHAELLQNTLLKHTSLPCMHIKREGVYKSWSYQDLHNDLNRLVYVLKKAGLKRGTNAIVIGENSPEWLIAHHAIILTGACVVPVDPNIPPSEIESITSITEAKIIFCSLPYLNMFKDFKSKYSFINKIITFDSKNDKSDNFSQFIKGGNDQKDAFTSEFHPDDPMVIIFTSGTTGKAKGVVLCQKNFTAVAIHAAPRMKLTSNDTACAVLPLHHVFGFAACIVGPMAAGSDIVFVPHVKGPLILEALRDKEVTYLPAVPKMLALFYESIIHNVKKKGPLVQTLFTGMKTISASAGEQLGTSFKRKLFSSVHKSFGGKLRLIISGGAALNKRYWLGFRQMGFTIVEGYGLTETFGPITVSPGEDVRWGSVGPVLAENKIKISDPDNNGIGEVLLQGSCVFKGYYKNDEQTQAVFDDHGWFHTGDLGRLDKDGFLYLSGRKKDVIILDNGKNVYPDELEDIYSTSTLIEEIGIFGVNSDDGEIVVAAIVPAKEIRKSQTVAQATDIIYDELVRIGKTLPVYRRITDFVTVYNPLPRTTTKKLKKQELLKLYNSIKRKSGNRTIDAQLSVLEISLMETEEYVAILDSIKIISPNIETSIINPRSHMEIDIGLDSLQKIELLTILEHRFHISIPDDIFDKMETTADLVSLIRENRDSRKKLSLDGILSLKERIINESPAYVKLPGNSSIIDKTALPFFRKAFNVFSGTEVLGLEELKSINAPVIFTSNHNHQNDIFTILEVLPEPFKSNTFFFIDSKQKQFTSRLYRKNLLNPGKENDPIEILRMSIAVIRNRKNLIAFPEGCISNPGILGVFKSGIGLIACETAATIIPIKITGPLHLKSSKVRYDKKFVIFGKPITYKEFYFGGKSKKCSVEEISSYIREVIDKI